VDHVSTSTRRRGGWTIVAAGAVLIASLLVTRGTEPAPAACSGSLIPAYLPPAVFAGLVGAARVLIVNPDSGPGAGSDPAQREAVARARAAGARVLGYIATTFGARNPDDVLADAQRYRDWYGVDGVFLDEVAHDDPRLPYYRDLTRRLRAARASYVVLNPGVVPARGYFDLADVVVTFEGPYSAYGPWQMQRPDWLKTLQSRTANLIYGASHAEARAVFSSPRQAAYVYVTSGTPPDPWATPPPYLHEEQAALGRCT
jgi:Spherulation-specific family 4